MLRLLNYYSRGCGGVQPPLAPESPQSWYDLNSDIMSLLNGSGSRPTAQPELKWLSERREISQKSLKVRSK